MAPVLQQFFQMSFELNSCEHVKDRIEAAVRIGKKSGDVEGIIDGFVSITNLFHFC